MKMENGKELCRCRRRRALSPALRNLMGSARHYSWILFGYCLNVIRNSDLQVEMRICIHG